MKYKRHINWILSYVLFRETFHYFIVHCAKSHFARLLLVIALIDRQKMTAIKIFSPGSWRAMLCFQLNFDDKFVHCVSLPVFLSLASCSLSSLSATGNYSTRFESNDREREKEEENFTTIKIFYLFLMSITLYTRTE
jgi:hypothetical protein